MSGVPSLQHSDVRRELRAAREADEHHVLLLQREAEFREEERRAYERTKVSDGLAAALEQRMASLEQRLDPGRLRLQAGEAAVVACERYRELVLDQYELRFRELLAETRRDCVRLVAEYVNQQVAHVEAEFEQLRRELASERAPEGEA